MAISGPAFAEATAGGAVRARCTYLQERFNHHSSLKRRSSCRNPTSKSVETTENISSSSSTTHAPVLKSEDRVSDFSSCGCSHVRRVNETYYCTESSTTTSTSSNSLLRNSPFSTSSSSPPPPLCSSSPRNAPRVGDEPWSTTSEVCSGATTLPPSNRLRVHWLPGRGGGNPAAEQRHRKAVDGPTGDREPCEEEDCPTLRNSKQPPLSTSCTNSRVDNRGVNDERGAWCHPRDDFDGSSGDNGSGVVDCDEIGGCVVVGGDMMDTNVFADESLGLKRGGRRRRNFGISSATSSYSRHRPWWCCWWTAVPLLVLCCMAPCVEAQLRPDTDLMNARDEGVCQSLDIRNSVVQLERLRGCRVVEGFVQILLIDHALEDNFINMSFPELREITGYLFVYRVSGLKSFEALFPNLSVIRGHTLFYNYALVAFEVLHLQRIGLHALTDILRGAVRFEKNPNLCFVDTIEWDLIAKNGKGEHYISGNKQINQCPICAPNSKCPTSLTTNTSLCWNGTKCQKVCPENCDGRACDEQGRCCHELCLGGCTGNTTLDCYVCRDVIFKGECMKRCPYNTYEYLNRRCIDEKECLNMPPPPELESESKHWKAFNGSCILDCPPGYDDVLVRGAYRNYSRCERCNDSCRKECDGASINSIASAQKFRGCTYIRGSLEIQLRGGTNIVKELEENLSMIEEIQGYLKVVRSFPLVSLNFLKNLSIIHGEFLEYEKYSLVVLDNQNLQELWDWSTKKQIVQVKRGRPFFHFNPKLCLYKIEKLKQPPNFTDFTDYEVATNSNGEKVACNVTVLKANVTQIYPNVAIISWEHFQHYDPRSLLGYVLYSTEAPTKNVTLYDGRDACGGDGWVVDDVSVPANDPKEVFHIFTKLKPYTQYAFYVKTYTVATETTGAQSLIHYFRTLPDIPSIPMNLKAYSNSSYELVVLWQPPQFPNGNITHFLVVGMWEKDDQAFLEQRDYCFEPLNIPDKKSSVIIPEEKDTAEKDTCPCDEKKRIDPHEEKDIQFQIRFEDFLHNKVYVKRPNRKARDIYSGSNVMSSFSNRDIFKVRENLSYRGIPERMESTILTSPSTYKHDLASSSVTPSYQTSQGSSPPPSFEHKVVGTKIVLKNLRHFAEYNIAVQACREMTPDEEANQKTDKICSSKSIVTARTLKLDVADNVDHNMLSIEVSNQTAGSVKLKWEEPPQPNGIVVTYQINFSRVDVESYKPTVVCITRRHYLENGRSYTLRNLHPGSYSLRLRATSLAGNGAYTKRITFVILESPSATRNEHIVFGVIGTSILIIFAFGFVFYKKKYAPKVPNMKLIASVNPEYVSAGAVYIPDEWEVPRKKIELLRELGQGSFGMVYEGIARDIAEGKPEIRCAIKTVNEHATDRERIEFLNEASVMKAFNTHHVVQLLGVVSQGQPTLVVMELMANGDLKTYLRSHRPDTSAYHGRQPPTLKRILQMAIEIADGMAYLSAKKFVHRDLAARNCMVADDLTVKIGDFGMTRDIYETDYYRKGTKGLLPVRWMAPESLKDGVFTSYSDVWSYGVVLWEMATLASQPYQGLSNDQVLRYVIDGGVMERPENCPDKLYELMRICWQHKPVTRPTFLTLVSMLEADVMPSFASVSFYHSREGEELRNHNTAPTVIPLPFHPPPTGARMAEVEEDDDDDEEDVIGAAQTPTTPLRLTRDVEDFSVGGDSASDVEIHEEEDDDEDEEEGRLRNGSKEFSSKHERKGSGSEGGEKMHSAGGSSSGRWASTGGDGSKGMSVYSSDSSKGSKVSNGSAATNGYMLGRHNSSGVLKTTEC